MGYYPAAPYNPYFQYGQGPNPGFQQYYPMAQGNRAPYGQPAPQAPPAQAAQAAAKPVQPPAHSPYGAQPSYPSTNAFEDQSFGLRSYGDKPQPAAGAQPQQTYGAQGGAGLHNFLGVNTPPISSASSQASSRPGQVGTPDDAYKTPAGGASRVPPSAPQAQQAQGQPQYSSYYGGGYPAQNQNDWSQYGQQQQQFGGRAGQGYWQ